MHRVLTATLAGTALIAAGCSPELDQARTLAPTGSEFQRALYNGYLDLAQAELDENDLDDAGVFARRAAMAARGQTVLPETLRRRTLPPKKAVELSKARQRLIVALNEGAREKLPRHAAMAQLGFDCWMQEAEENFQPGDIAGCRADFHQALARIDAVKRPAMASGGQETPARLPLTATAAPRTATAAPGTATAAMGTATAFPEGRFTVLFGHDSAAITTEARRKLSRAAGAAAKAGKTVVVVSGHADRAGPNGYNMALSDRRARAVATTLSAAGPAGVAVETRAYGEARPVVATGDGVREPRNRRVEIEFREALARTASRR